MTSPVPGVIAWPVITLLVLLTIVRFALINSSITDRLINQALAFAAVGMLLREQATEDLLGRFPGPIGDIDLLRQLSFCAIIGIVQALYGIGKLWDGADPATAQKRQRRYYVVGLILSAVVLFAGTPARMQNVLIDQELTWSSAVLWCAFYAPILVCATLYLRLAVRELRAGDNTSREKAIYAANIGISGVLVFDAVVTPLNTIYEVISNTRSKDPEMHIKALTFFLATTAASLITIVPTVSALRVRFGRDRTGRNRRLLEPLWQDLTALFPEVVARDRLATDTEAARLHRMTIEIHDALLRLRPYATPVAKHDDVASPTAAAAVQVARAYTAKLHGTIPSNSGVQLDILTMPTKSTHLTAASDNLVDLARQWQTALAQCAPAASR
ncbi:hypothetical protein OG921_04915 [Aldersonia sp. NBC_00410]|uniref:MAB_1171c family putative transporter n=1 Tax=Aldersonia sp. NBC_00410 TaxID=2975954 RepID=UPI00225A6CAD|nr:MAB_1171c family putative transporter [Aldersonia sp. NBC_00410]MCX5042513.1 hypothetical protein [Aldersonia sp. NBC_00410]